MTLPYAIVILISALAFVVVAISIALGIYGLRKWKRVTVAVASSPTEILGLYGPEALPYFEAILK